MDQTPHLLQISIAVDFGLMNRIQAQSAPQVQAFVEGFFGLVRVIYLTQLNVELQIKQLLLPLSGDKSVLGRSRENGLCAPGAIHTMSDFQKYVSRRNSRASPRSTATWHLLTDCHPRPGTVGSSYVGGLCQVDMMVSISSWTGETDTYLTFAHELGHMFGAGHTSEVGNRGGIMDYGSGQYLDGPVEFSPKN